MNDTLKGWKAVKSTINIVALEAVVTCRARQKMPCSKTATLSGSVDNPDWCYMSVGYSASEGVLRTSRNLILTTDFHEYNSRVWVTEGAKIAGNSHYSDTLEVILERQPPGVNSTYRDDLFSLTVCSFSGPSWPALALVSERTSSQKKSNTSTTRSAPTAPTHPHGSSYSTKIGSITRIP